MANLTAAIQRVRRTHTDVSSTPPRNLDRYRPEYEAILRAVETLGGEPAFDELVAWMIDRTRSSGRVPPPDAVRRHARDRCAARGIEVPDGSPLLD